MIGRNVYRDDPAAYFEMVQERDGLSDHASVSLDWPAWQVREHYARHEAEILQRLGNRIPGSTALDVGCGAGHWLRFFRDCGGSAVGMDFSDRVVRALDGWGFCVVKDDIAEATFSVEPIFDIVCAMGVMPHIADDERWRIAIRHCLGVTKPGGFLVFSGGMTKTGDIGRWRRERNMGMWLEAVRDAGGAVVDFVRVKSRGTMMANLMFVRRV